MRFGIEATGKDDIEAKSGAEALKEYVESQFDEN